MSVGEARAKLMAFRESLADRHGLIADQEDSDGPVRRQLEDSGKEIWEAVEKGLITREEAEDRIRAIRERLRKGSQADR